MAVGGKAATAEPKLIKREKVFAKNFAPPFIIFSLPPSAQLVLLQLQIPPFPGQTHFFRPGCGPFSLAFAEL